MNLIHKEEKVLFLILLTPLRFLKCSSLREANSCSGRSKGAEIARTECGRERVKSFFTGSIIKMDEGDLW